METRTGTVREHVSHLPPRDRDIPPTVNIGIKYGTWNIKHDIPHVQAVQKKEEKKHVNLSICIISFVLYFFHSDSKCARPSQVNSVLTLIFRPFTHPSPSVEAQDRQGYHRFKSYRRVYWIYSEACLVQRSQSKDPRCIL